jgi:hypothetical protein
MTHFKTCAPALAIAFMVSGCSSSEDAGLAVAITSPEENAALPVGTFFVHGTVGGAAAAGVWVKLDEGEFLPATNTGDGFSTWMANVSVSHSGTHALTARAVDAEGNESLASRSIQVVPGVSGSVLFSDDFEALPLGTGWLDGSNHGDWTCIYCGSGDVGIALDGSQVASLRSNAVTSPGQTLSTLLMTKRRDFGDIDFTIRMKTVAQTRTGSSPNTWETAWILWRYDTINGTQGYYATLKTNGFEVGKFKGQPPDNQEFLMTVNTPAVKLAEWQTVRIQMVGDKIEIWVDGISLGSVVDDSSSWEVFAQGAIALYEEDAQAHFDDLVVQVP